ncbi:MAG: C1 family peptidase [Oligoflexia bacterium]|nr:C1 family peptidase [Oligoflexia bacterium]
MNANNLKLHGSIFKFSLKFFLIIFFSFTVFAVFTVSKNLEVIAQESDDQNSVLDINQTFMDEGELQNILIDMSEKQSVDDYYLLDNWKINNMENNIIIPTIEELIPKNIRDNIDKRKKQSAGQAEKINFPSTLPEKIDLRYRDTKVKSQFGGTCTAFGLLASMENYINGYYNVLPEDRELSALSERHFWSLYKTTSVKAAMTAAKKYYITEQKYWPTNQKKPKAGYKDHRHTKLLSSVYIDDDIIKALESLARGNPVYIGMTVSKGMKSCATVVTPLSAKTNGGHALAVVGYQLNPKIQGGGYFIIKNSWGNKCGDKGYQYIPFYHCQRKGMYCVMWEITSVETKFD